MARIDQSTTRPADDLVAIERAFESLLESTDLVYPDEYIELRRGMMEAFDDEYRLSKGVFKIQNILSAFADRIWGFAAEVAKRDGDFSKESVSAAFQSFVRGGEIFLERSLPSARNVLQLVSGSKFQYLLINAEIAGSNLQTAAEFLLDDASGIAGFSTKLERSRSLAKDGDEAAIADLSEMILGEGLVGKMAELSYAFEDYYFGPFVEKTGMYATQALEAYEKGEDVIFGESIGAINGLFLGIMDAYENMRDVHNALSRTITIVKRAVGDDDEGVAEILMRHKIFMANYAAVGHDYSNLLSAINGHLQLIEIEKDKLRQLIELEGVCRRHRCTNILMLLELVKMSKSIELDAEGMDVVQIPKGYRRLLFRSVFELVRNAQKYSDKDKKDQWIRIRATRKGYFTEIVVEDNGVGIEDVDAVLGEGVRERPDLAEGFGIGLASIARTAKDNPWEFKIVSTPRVGTKATITIDESRWAQGGAGGVGGGVGGALLPYAPLLAGASVFLGIGII